MKEENQENNRYKIDEINQNNDRFKRNGNKSKQRIFYIENLIKYNKNNENNKNE